MVKRLNELRQQNKIKFCITLSLFSRLALRASQHKLDPEILIRKKRNLCKYLF